MRYKKNFKRTSWGYIVVDAKNKKEAQEKFDNGEWLDEFDNKSDYELDDGVYRE